MKNKVLTAITMEERAVTYSILITTKNRKTDLAFTLGKIKNIIKESSVHCVVFDDGSTDGTYEYVKENFSNIQLQRNPVSKGYIFCRNKMLNETQADYAISLDDDAHFLTENPLEFIQQYFGYGLKMHIHLIMFKTQ